MITAEMGIMSLALTIAVISMIIAIVALCKLSKLNKKYKIFMTGENAQSLESVLKDKLDEMSALKAATEKNTTDIEMLFSKMEKAVCKVGVVKYDAFNEMGGKLSFALVMLDEQNNGFSMNSMHGQEGSYVYVKELIHGESYIPLGDEELKALKAAMGTEEI
jgi:hypothetical protein